MKTIITLAAFVGLIASVTGQYFRVFAEHSASAIHLLPWSASGQRIWLGKDTASYCPSVVVKNCPKGDYTNFVGGNGGLGMGTEVPGGQLVYIDPECGALGYTAPHSATMPENATTTGWSLSQGESYGFLGWTNGLLACSVMGDPEKGPWQVYAQLANIDFGEGCLGLDAITSNSSAPAAWEYMQGSPFAMSDSQRS